MRAPVRREIICCRSETGGAHLVLFANESWLPLESAFPAEVAAEREKGLRLGQVGLFAGNAAGAALILRLFARAWRRFLALELDVVLAAVDPGDASLYRRLLFESAGWGRRSWDFADYAAVEVLRLDVQTVAPRMTSALRRRFTKREETAP